jgi:hypothetical protein
VASKKNFRAKNNHCFLVTKELNKFDRKGRRWMILIF